MLLATETPVAEKPAEEESAATVITTVTLTRNTYAKHPRFSAGVFSRVRPLSMTCSSEHLALTFSLQTAALARLIMRSLAAAKLHESQLGEKPSFSKTVF